MDLRQFEVLPPWEWSEDSSEILHQAVTDKSASTADREAAAEYAGDMVVINNQLVEDLLAIIGDPSEGARLRGISAIALGPVLEQTDDDDYGDPYAEPSITQATLNKIKTTLRRFYDDSSFPKQVRRRILEASVRSSEDWHRSAIQTAYTSGDREWLLTAVFAMRFVKGFPEQILESLNNPDREIQGEAVMAAGNWELEAGWPHIRSLLKKPNTPKPLLLAAIEAAGQIGADGSLQLLENLTKSKDSDIRAAAEEALEIPNFDDLEEDDEDDEDFDN